LLPGAGRSRHVAGEILRLPGEPLTHRVPRHAIAEDGEGVALAGLPAALDELHDADAASVAEHPERQAEGGRRLALARAGVDDQQALLDRLLRNLGILHLLALRHLGAVALGVAVGNRTHLISPSLAGRRP